MWRERNYYPIKMFGCLLGFVLGFVFFGQTLTASDIILTFDTNSDPALASDSSGNDANFPYLGASAQSNEIVKFGSGSMVLGTRELTGFSNSLASTPYSDFCAPISQMTISLWVYPRSDDAGDMAVFLLQRLNGSREGGFSFGFSAARQLTFYVGIENDGVMGTSKVNSSQTPGLMFGEWTHLAMTFDQGEVVFYYNGERVGSPLTMLDGVTSVPAIADARIGVLRGLVSSAGISHIDDFGFFSEKALSAADIATIYEKGLVESGLSEAKP